MMWFDRYEMLEILGSGSTSQVFAARDLVLNRKVAIKIIEPLSASFYYEAELLKNENLKIMPALYDMWKENNSGILVMEYIEGVSGRQFIKEYGKASVEQLKKWGTALAEMLQYMHHMVPQILYRNLKPDNIIITMEGDIRLIDAGTAFSTKESIAEGYRIGTVGYAAPEQWEFGECSVQSDIYTLGTLLYDLSIGCSMEDTPYLRTHKVDTIPEAMQVIFEKCLAKDKDKRYQTISSFLKDWNCIKKTSLKKEYMCTFLQGIKKICLLCVIYTVWIDQTLFKMAGICFTMYLVFYVIHSRLIRDKNWWTQEKSVWFHEG